MKLLLDEMISGAIAEQLRERGQDVSAVVDLGDLRGLADPELFNFNHAQREERAVVTYNREDYLALDRQSRGEARNHHGVVILNPRRFPQGPASAGPLVTALQALLTGGQQYPSFVHWLR